MTPSIRTNALNILLLLVFLVLMASCSQDEHVTKGVSEEYPCFRVKVTDTSSLSDKYISIGLIGLTKNALDALILEEDGSPFVHLWGEDSDAPVREQRPWRIGWNENQKTFSVIYLSDEPILLSRNLEQFEGRKLNQRYDGRAAVLSDDGKLVTVINEWETVVDKYDYVDTDSIPINWTLWHIEDSIGNKEIVDLKHEYADIDVYAYGAHTVQGQEQATLDPLHGNSADYSSTDSTMYLGMSMRTLDEILIYARDIPSNEEKYYHFGGPYNDFSFPNDAVIAYRPHDFRFIETTDTTVTISFYSNGDGKSTSGTYAAGKVVKLDLKQLSAELIMQSVASTTHSSWMGSYDFETNSFAPGVIEYDKISSNTVLWFSPVLFKELDETGKELIRLEASYLCPRVAFRSDRFDKAGIDEAVNRPKLSVHCEGDKVLVSAQQHGLYDEMKFFVNDEEWEGDITTTNNIELDSGFSGKISVMSRLKIDKYNFYVDKYSKPTFIGDNYCVQNKDK